MMVGAGVAVQDGALVALGAEILTEVRENMLVTPAGGGGLVDGSFLGVRSAPAGSRCVFPVGKLSEVEKLHDGAVTKVDEMSSEKDKASWVVSIVPHSRSSGETEQIQTPTDELVETLPPPPQLQAVTLTVVGGPQPRGPNELPLLRDHEQQLAFLVKASELSVNGMLVLNGASAAALHVWILQKQAFGDKSKSVCEHTGWQTCISLVPFVMYLLTAWVTSMAKGIEKPIEKASTEQATGQEPICLNVISGFVLAFFIWPVLMGGLLTHCMTGAAIWILLLVETPLIMIMFAIWAATFSQPEILRRCFCSWCNCCGRETEVNAAAQHAGASSMWPR